MSVHLYLAPAAGGKTAYVLDLVRDAAKGLRSIPRVVVPSYLQVRAWRRRLAEAGGTIGVRVLTFNRLYAECLSAAGEVVGVPVIDHVIIGDGCWVSMKERGQLPEGKG